MTNEENILYKNIDDLLWKEWDPLGVNEFEEARGEYYSYVPQVFKMKVSKIDGNIIAAYLFKIETEQMGLFGNFENCKIIAGKIILM